jgi:cytochrome c553
MRSRCLFAALLLALLIDRAGAAAPEQAVPDTLEQRLLACATCHARVDARGNPVNDSFFPRIGGKPAGYLYNQLRNFRDGRRQYPLMTYLVEHLPDAYLREIAEHFAAQPSTVLPPVAAPQASARGRQLAVDGDRTRGIPACIACHGARLTGVRPSIPGLLGLPRDYVNAQFGAWRNGARRADAPDCMAQITARMSLEDVAAVAGWLAAQPMPTDPAPAASVARPLPLACGSAMEAR